MTKILIPLRRNENLLHLSTPSLRLKKKKKRNIRPGLDASSRYCPTRIAFINLDRIFPILTMADRFEFFMYGTCTYGLVPSTELSGKRARGMGVCRVRRTISFTSLIGEFFLRHRFRWWRVWVAVLAARLADPNCPNFTLFGIFNIHRETVWWLSRMGWRRKMKSCRGCEMVDDRKWTTDASAHPAGRLESRFRPAWCLSDVSGLLLLSVRT